MKSVISDDVQVPVSLMILARTKVEGETLLTKFDRTQFAQTTVSNMSALEKDMDAVSGCMILLVDLSLQDGRVMEALKRLRGKYSHSQLAILCVVKKADTEMLIALIQEGIDDFFISPVTIDALKARLLVCAQMLRREYALSQSLTQDNLTGLANRQRFLDQATSVYASAKRDQLSLTVLMIAPDHLSVINAKHGQNAGDMILLKIAQLLTQRKRDTDLLCRYDGNRFCLLAINLMETHLITFLDDILASIQAQEFKIDDRVLPMTASIGATLYLGRSISDMLAQAEQALFLSKKDGHNRFSVFNEIQAESVPTWSSLN